MIPVENLIYGIDLKLNKLSNFDNQAIPVENKIIALNNAQIKLVTTKLNPNNSLVQGFEAMRKRYEDLQVLIESSHDHPLLLEEVDTRLNKWSASLEELIPKYMMYVDAYVLADKGECKDRVIYVNHDLTKHGDVTLLLNNSNFRPSFEYQETFPTLTNNYIDIYTDGSFTPTYVYLSYIRYPKEIDYPGYIKMNGEESKQQDSELPDYLEQELLNFAILELGFATENVPAIQFTQERIKTQE